MTAPQKIEAAYADSKVAQIDERLSALKQETADLTERRKVYAPHVTKRSAKKD